MGLTASLYTQTGAWGEDNTDDHDDLFAYDVKTYTSRYKVFEYISFET